MFPATWSNTSLLMSSTDLITIPVKQGPVINRLNDAMIQAIAYASAIRDNAQDDGQPIPFELVTSFCKDYDKLIELLTEAACVRSRQPS